MGNQIGTYEYHSGRAKETIFCICNTLKTDYMLFEAELFFKKYFHVRQMNQPTYFSGEFLTDRAQTQALRELEVLSPLHNLFKLQPSPFPGDGDWSFFKVCIFFYMFRTDVQHECGLALLFT